MATLRNLAGETVIYGLSHVLPRIFHFLVMTVYLTHRFNDSTVDFGIYSELYAYATLILAFLTFRMDTAYFRFASRSQDKEAVFFNLLLPIMAAALVVCAAMVIFSREIAVALQYPDQSYYVTWFALILGFDALTTLVYARFRLNNRPYRFLLYRIANVVITVIFVLFFLELVPRYDAGLLDDWMLTMGLKRELDFVFLSNLLASFIIVLAMLPEFMKIKIRPDAAFLRTAVKYAWPLVIVALAGNINQSFALIIQKYWLTGTVEENLAQTGIYSAGAKMAIFLNLFTVAFNYAAEPFFFNNAAKDGSESIYGRVALAYTIVACIVTLTTYFFIDIVMLMVGDSYREGIIVVPILLLSYVFLGLYYMVGIWYKLSDNTIMGALVSLAGMVVTIAASYFLLPGMGIVGSAWASLLCFTFMVFLCYQLGKRYHPINYPWASILGAIGLAALGVLASYAFRHVFFVEGMMLALLNAVLLAAYLFFIYLQHKDTLIELVRRN